VPQNPKPPSKKKKQITGFLRDLAVTFIGTFLAFALAVWWDLSKRADENNGQARWAANVVYAEVQTNYRRLVPIDPILRAAMALIKRQQIDSVLSASPVSELDEPATREVTVNNSQVRRRELLHQALPFTARLTVKSKHVVRTET